MYIINVIMHVHVHVLCCNLLPVAAVLTRYMRWQLKDGMGLVVRCEYDAVLPPPKKSTSSTFMNIKALNEWDSKVWRHIVVKRLICIPLTRAV